MEGNIAASSILVEPKLPKGVIDCEGFFFHICDEAKLAT
jgi:hypothetical protein